MLPAMADGVQGRSHSGELDAATAREVAQTMQALATSSRVRILGRLRQSPCTVGERAAEHGHSHGLVDRSIVRSRAGVRTVAISLAVLGLTAAAQVVIFVLSNSVALLADLIHNFGDALTAVPLGIAFYLRSFRGEKLAGLAVVLTIFISACVALYETIVRLIHPQHLSHLWVLAAAGIIGFIGNEIAARVRLRGGKRLHSPALIADGNHARIDRLVSLGAVGSASVGGPG